MIKCSACGIQNIVATPTKQTKTETIEELDSKHHCSSLTFSLPSDTEVIDLLSPPKKLFVSEVEVVPTFLYILQFRDGDDMTMEELLLLDTTGVSIQRNQEVNGFQGFHSMVISQFNNYVWQSGDRQQLSLDLQKIKGKQVLCYLPKRSEKYEATTADIEILKKNESMEKNDHTAVKIESLDDGQMEAMVGQSATKDLLSSCMKMQSEDMSNYTSKENDESNDDT
ncbi:hypothetical protein LOZ36_006676 [Ophidiomyces ophidiicola]|nr:hypothetical protein LOZ36_006676 [Ophidiomyces ophidiicola]